MSRIKKRNIGLLLGLVILLSALAVAVVGALPAYETTKTYYYDAAHTQYAGEIIHLCNGQVIKYGVKTQYYTVYQEPCL